MQDQDDNVEVTMDQNQDDEVMQDQDDNAELTMEQDEDDQRKTITIR